MTPSNGYFAKGTTLTWNEQLIAEQIKISGPGKKVDTIEMTNHDSADLHREFIAGLHDGGEISFEGNFVPGDTAGIIAMNTDMDAGTARTAIITGPTAGPFTWTVTAICTGLNFDHPDDDKGGVSGTLKITGKPVLAVSASANLTTLTGIEENTGAALTFTPAFAGAKYTYNIAVNTASTWVKFTPTLAGATITISNGTTSQSVASGAQSGTIALTDGAVTTITLSVKETGKVGKVYTCHIYTP